MFDQGWKRCQSNLSANIITGICIAFAGGIICLGYYKNENLAHVLDQLGMIKKKFGFFYSAISTSFFGGIIPYFVMIFRQNIPKDKKRSWFLFFLIFWAIKGIEVDAFYRLQSFLHGESNSLRIILFKVLTDMFIYCVFWSAPITAIFYGWKKVDFVWSEVEEIRSIQRLASESIFLLLSTWIIWIPAVTVIYAMPPNLQIPCFNLTLCFFVLVISCFTPKKRVAG